MIWVGKGCPTIKLRLVEPHGWRPDDSVASSMLALKLDAADPHTYRNSVNKNITERVLSEILNKYNTGQGELIAIYPGKEGLDENFQMRSLWLMANLMIGEEYHKMNQAIEKELLPSQVGAMYMTDKMWGLNPEPNVNPINPAGILDTESYQAISTNSSGYDLTKKPHKAWTKAYTILDTISRHSVKWAIRSQNQKSSTPINYGSSLVDHLLLNDLYTKCETLYRIGEVGRCKKILPTGLVASYVAMGRNDDEFKQWASGLYSLKEGMMSDASGLIDLYNEISRGRWPNTEDMATVLGIIYPMKYDGEGHVANRIVTNDHKKLDKRHLIFTGSAYDKAKIKAVRLERKYPALRDIHEAWRYHTEKGYLGVR